MKIRVNTKIAISIIILIIISYCGIKQKDDRVEDLTSKEIKTEIVVSAAVSLRSALEEIRDLYNNERLGAKLILNFGSSGSLKQQIEQGAPVDIFISASKENMDSLCAQAIVVEESKIDLVKNAIVLAVPKESKLIGLEGLLSDDCKKIAIGEPNIVPVGKYAYEAIKGLNLLEGIKDKLIYGKDAKDVVAWLETSNVDAGFIYKTDAKFARSIRIVPIDFGQLHSLIVYPAAIIKRGKNIEESKKFMNFIIGEKSKNIFIKYGFMDI